MNKATNVNKTMKLMMAAAVCALATAAGAVGTKGPALLKGEKLPFYGREAECYLPWEDKVVKTTLPALPDFWRSIVVRLDTPKDYEPFQEAH